MYIAEYIYYIYYTYDVRVWQVGGLHGTLFKVHTMYLFYYIY